MAWLAGPVEHRWHSLYLSVLEVSTVEADDLSVSDLETAEPLVRSAFGTTFRARVRYRAHGDLHTEVMPGFRDWLLRHVPSLAAVGQREPDAGRLNVDGLAWDPNTRTLLLGLRGPRTPEASRRFGSPSTQALPPPAVAGLLGQPGGGLADAWRSEGLGVVAHRKALMRSTCRGRLGAGNPTTRLRSPERRETVPEGPNVLSHVNRRTTPHRRHPTPRFSPYPPSRWPRSRRHR